MSASAKLQSNVGPRVEEQYWQMPSHRRVAN